MLFIKSKRTLLLLRKSKRTLLFLRKSNSKIFFLLLLIFSNFWIYKIFAANSLLGLLISLISFVVYLNLKNTKIILICLIFLIFLQIQTTEIKSLTNLDNDQQRVQQERIRSYPLTYINLYFKVVWLKPVEWIEKNNLVIILSRIEENLFDNLGINKFFFAGFPRNNPSDFEKFPYIYLPIFVLGVINFVKTKQFGILILLFLIPILVLAIIGNSNNIGPIVLFPFLIAASVTGINLLTEKYLHKSWKK